MTDFEKTVLLFVKDGETYGVPLRDVVSRATGKDVSIGAIYVTMDDFEKRGWVTSRMGDPTPERGNRAKKFWMITDAGRAAFRETLRGVADHKM